MTTTTLFLLTLFVAIAATLAVRWFALRYGIVDVPDKPRKIHRKAVPLLGGAAIFIAFFLGLFLSRDMLLARGLVSGQLVAFAAGAVMLLIGGVWDDLFEFKKPQYHIIFPTLAAVILITGGVSIVKLTNPFGATGGIVQFGAVISATLTLLWVLGMVYTTKLLDGVDGLVSGLGVISGLIIFLFTMTTRYYQPDVGLMGLLFAAACLGFLLFNFHPAKIFLGDSGSLLVGYVIAVLAIISGAKIAIALLIMGIPILDVAWTIVRRLCHRQNPFKSADKKHLHHRFLDMGLSQRQTVVIYYGLAVFFGALALFLQSKGKIIAIGALAVIMVLVAFLSVFEKR